MKRMVKKQKDTIPETEAEERDEDRISKLPDDMILQILSLTDAKNAIETSQLSNRWKQLWKSVTHLNFDNSRFPPRPPDQFSEFVSGFIAHRNNQVDVFELNFSCTIGTIQSSLISKIATYASSHNVRKIDISCNISMSGICKCGVVKPLPLSVFSCPSLEQLCLRTRDLRSSNVPECFWVLPALTTLLLEQVSFRYCCDGHDSSKSVDIFSNLLNLKNLSLIDCRTDGLEEFSITSPQLENLFISIKCWRGQYGYCKFVVSAPKLSSFKYTGCDGLLLSANDITCLDTIHIDIDDMNYICMFGDADRKRRICQEIVNMFQQLRHAANVSVTLLTVQVLTWILELIKDEPSPFNKMKCLKIVGARPRRSRYKKRAPMSTGVVTYLCNSSPSSTVVNESKEKRGDWRRLAPDVQHSSHPLVKQYTMLLGDRINIGDFKGASSRKVLL